MIRQPGPCRGYGLWSPSCRASAPRLVRRRDARRDRRPRPAAVSGRCGDPAQPHRRRIRRGSAPPSARRHRHADPTADRPRALPGEYEPAAGLCIAWEGSAGWTAILTQIARHVTTTGQARIWCYVDSTSERTSVAATLAAAGCAMGSVQFLVRTTDTIWMRDYGPRYIYEGGCRAIVDHTPTPRRGPTTMPCRLTSALRWATASTRSRWSTAAATST